MKRQEGVLWQGDVYRSQADLQATQEKHRKWAAASKIPLSGRHIHYWQPNEGDLDSRGSPRGRWVYVQCVNYNDRKHCYLKQARLAPQEYLDLAELGFVRLVKRVSK